MTKLKLWLGFTGTQIEGEFFHIIFNCFPLLATFYNVMVHDVKLMNMLLTNNAPFLTFGSCSRTLTFDLTKYRES